MGRRNSCKPIEKAEAVVHRVDPVNREVAALIDGLPVTIDVPPDCHVVLRGERVKLRMVQPGDRVRVTYTKLATSLVAREFEVQSAYPSPSRSQGTANSR